MENPSKLTKNNEKSFKIDQKQYIMTYCCRNSMEGTLIQYTGQKTVSRITPAYYMIYRVSQKEV